MRRLRCRDVPAIAHEAPCELTLWSWLPNFQDQVSLFEAAHPNIKVNLINAGQGGDEYTKLRAALKAGSGLPDVCHMEFQLVRSFRAAQGVGRHRSVGQRAQGRVRRLGLESSERRRQGLRNAVGQRPDRRPLSQRRLRQVQPHRPEDVGGVCRPGDQAARGRAGRLSDRRDFSDGGWVTSLLWQAGWRPFEVNGAEIRIQVNGEVAKKFAAYWQKLIDAKAIEAKPGFVTEWYTSLDEGRYATWLTAGWGPVLLTSFAKNELGQMARCANSAVGREQVRRRPTGAVRRSPRLRPADTRRKRPNWRSG